MIKCIETHTASYRFRRFAFRERQMFSSAARALRRVLPLRQFGFFGRTTIPRSTRAGAKLWPLAGGLHSLLTRLELLTVVVTRTLGNGYALAGVRQSQPLGTVTAFDAVRFASVYGGDVLTRPLARISTGVIVLTGRTLYAWKIISIIDDHYRVIHLRHCTSLSRKV